MSWRTPAIGFILLFVTQRDQGIDAHGAARGQVTGQHRDHGHYCSHASISNWIYRANPIEFTRQPTGHSESASQTKDDADGRESRALSHDQPQNITALRTERHADAEFASAFGYQEAEYSVDADH